MSMLNKPIFDDVVFDNFFNPGPSSRKNLLRCDIYESDNTTYIEMDCITNRKENVDIKYENQHLIIEIHKEVVPLDSKARYILKERTNNEYFRDIYVGDIDFNKASASLKNGTLIIQIPKNKDNSSLKNSIRFEE